LTLNPKENPMADDIFASAAERTEFGEMVDCIERGQPEMLPARLVERYVAQGLMRRDGAGLHLTDLGRDQYRISLGERQSDG
jgi:hypothetical protein